MITRRRVVGLTLIELMVALAVFAVLGTLTYRGADALLTGNRHISAELERWRELVRAMQIVESELLQITHVPTQGDPAKGGASVEWRSDPATLSFLSLAGGHQPERIVFRFEQGRLDWERHALQAGAHGERDTLLSNIDEVRWLFLADNTWHAHWPVSDATITQIPAAIGVELALPGIGRVNRIYALR